MNTKKIFLAAVLADFALLTVWGVSRFTWQGFVGIFNEPIAIVMAVDLVIALSVGCSFLWRDARSRGINPVPYVIITLLTGSVGTLAYLIARDKRPVLAAAVEPQTA